MFGSIAPLRWGRAAVVAVVVAVAAWAVPAVGVEFPADGVRSRADGVEFPADGVVVLRNGNVLAGAVKRAGAYYRVASAGATLQVPASQVEMVCRNFDEAYQMRRNTRGGSTADTHIELARWCLRQNLLEQAALELNDARAADPGHPALGSIDLQLAQMIQTQTARPPSTAAAPPAASPPTTAALLAAPAPAFEISTEARTQFVRSIQPMLIRTCATAGCHQPGSHHQLQLDRWALVGNGNATIVRRNLAAVVQWINKDDPASSQLLLRAQQEHGATPGAQSKSLEPLQEKMLLQWMNDAAGIKPPDPAEVETIADPTAAEALQQSPSTSAQPTSAPATSSPQAPQAALAPQPSAPFTPRDAFDPEIFNRRTASQAATTAKALATASSAQESAAP